MPNHCANSLKITATTPEARELLATIRAGINAEQPKLFQVIDPCPAELLDTRKGYPKDDREAVNVEKFGFPTWYEFNTTRWGTKWDAYEIDTLADEGNTLTLSFETAWSPPVSIYATLHARGFDVEATFCESGSDFIGYWKNGTDHTTALSVAVPAVFDDETGAAYDQMTAYFAAHGIDHEPAHFGG